MTAPDILQLAVTIAVMQIFCDLIANWLIFNKDRYQRALGALSRAKNKLEREKVAIGKESSKDIAINASSNSKKSKAERLMKRLQRAEDEYSEAKGVVARKHIAPGFFTSVFFVLLLRILGTEHKGQIMGIIPFTPFQILRKLTARGIEFGPLQYDPISEKVTSTDQACGFMFIYVLCGFSVKYYAGKLFGTKPPAGAEGVTSIMDSPTGQNMIRALGVDPADLKVD